MKMMGERFEEYREAHDSRHRRHYFVGQEELRGRQIRRFTWVEMLWIESR